jgi:hypothetical protein
MYLCFKAISVMVFGKAGMDAILHPVYFNTPFNLCPGLVAIRPEDIGKYRILKVALI